MIISHHLFLSSNNFWHVQRLNTN